MKKIERQREWLSSMASFCAELQAYLPSIPEDATLQDYARMQEEVAQKYPRMAEACSRLDTEYMQGIDASLRSEVEEVYCMGADTCRMVNRHPVLGVFQGIPETRVELFFERALNMCMALGAEHGLSSFNDKAKKGGSSRAAASLVIVCE